MGDPDDDGHDGVGALTGALDQLAFANDLDFDGDGVEEDPFKKTSSRRPELAAAEKAKLEAERIAREEEERKAARKAQLEGLNNQAFVDDEELLLASGLIDEEKLTEPRVTVEASTMDATTESKNAKNKVAPKPASDIGVFSNTRTRPVSARKRIGSAKRNITRFTKTFSDLAPLTPISGNDKSGKDSKNMKKYEKKDSSGVIYEDDEEWKEKKASHKNQISPSGSAEEGTSKDPEDSEEIPPDPIRDWSNKEVIFAILTI